METGASSISFIATALNDRRLRQNIRDETNLRVNPGEDVPALPYPPTGEFGICEGDAPGLITIFSTEEGLGSFEPMMDELRDRLVTPYDVFECSNSDCGCSLAFYRPGAGTGTVPCSEAGAPLIDAGVAWRALQAAHDADVPSQQPANVQSGGMAFDILSKTNSGTSAAPVRTKI